MHEAGMRDENTGVWCGDRYYLNGEDAFRLKLLLPLSQQRLEEITAQQLDNLDMPPQEP